MTSREALERYKRGLLYPEETEEWEAMMEEAWWRLDSADTIKARQFAAMLNKHEAERESR